jgi:hypothetical protein
MTSARNNSTTKYLKTINYEYIQIRYDKAYIMDEIIDIIEDTDGNQYEIMTNLNGKLVAILM